MRLQGLAIGLATAMLLSCIVAGAQNTKMNQAGANAAANPAPTHMVDPAAAARNENRISKEVRHQLLMLPYYSLFDDLEYQVKDGTVILKGQVVNPATKNDAESSVKHVEGVNKVVNQIQIEPPSPSDNRIRRAEYHAIYGIDGMYRYAMAAVPSIHIIVENGRVTLMGVVDNPADKHMAMIQAKSVPGVFQVTDELKVVNSGKEAAGAGK